MLTSTASPLRRCSAVAVVAGCPCGLPASPPSLSRPGGSEAGNDSVTASSWPSPLPSSSAASLLCPARVSKKAGLALTSEILSCGRFGPAIEGCTSPRSSCSVSEKVGSSLSTVWKRPCSRV